MDACDQLYFREMININNHGVNYVYRIITNPIDYCRQVQSTC